MRLGQGARLDLVLEQSPEGTVVRRTPAEDIVEFFGTLSDRVKELNKVSPGEWEHGLRWLDDAGLAFYFLEKLKRTNTDAVPAPVRRDELSAAEQGSGCKRIWLRIRLILQSFDNLDTNAGLPHDTLLSLYFLSSMSPGTQVRDCVEDMLGWRILFRSCHFARHPIDVKFLGHD